jgi:hypothetical protein
MSTLNREITEPADSVIFELFSNNTLLFKTAEKLGFWPDSAVMVCISNEKPVFAE